ncbi:hypothetical protein GR268_43955, partial [Rhizobium leguminosarum]|nr:hypothetical protein [Rhizobium leguminosarum]
NAGANKDSRNTIGYSPLHLAAAYNQYTAAVKLKEKGANINTVDSNGDTPLHVAIQKDCEEIMKCLAQAGADLDCKNNLRLTPIDLASQTGHLNYVQQIFSVVGTAVNEIGTDGCTHLHRAVKHGDLNLIKILLDLRANVNVKEENIFLKDNFDFIQKIFSPSRPNTMLNAGHGRTPLHIAIEQGEIAIVQHLIAAGANKS